ncbi:hypothetical protein NVP1250O_53 [Vibrio phage 1.250.O._10N.261.55.E11]|nr:hypothetical protein NVP1250O_53 [Vibrio phage 1.250.O._10N.261.55.E11]
MISLRTGLVIGSYVAAVALGVTANNWYRDSVALSELNAVNAAIEASQQREDRIADNVETKLATLRANERTRTIRIPEIIKQPELVRVCLSEDAINTINGAVNGLHDSTDAE